MCAACSMDRSGRKSSSGVVRRSRWRRSQLHTKPRALSRALNEAAHWSSGPRTEKYTFACLRSGLVSTSVTVTKPRRGSLS